MCEWACVCVCARTRICVGGQGIAYGGDEPVSFQNWEQPSQLTFRGFECKKWWQLIALASTQLQFATVDLETALLYSTI